MNRQTSNTFKYSNKTYTINVNLFTNTDEPSQKIDISLDPADIEEVMYEGCLNELLITGHVVYTDRYGAVDKMFGQHFGYASILFALNKKKSDNDVQTTSFDENNKFIHNFIISDLKVIDRQTSIIKYKIDLMSMNWFKCIANLRFSNYEKQPQLLFDILKDCISMQGLSINDESFSKVKTYVKLNYITQLNDNLISVVKYLLHKLYYYPTKDDSVKFLVYDWYNDKYRLIDLKNKDTSTGIFSTVLSFFKTNQEAMIQQDPTNIGSLGKSLPKTQVYQNAFEKDIFTYDFNYDAFGLDVSPPDQTINYFNNKIDNGNYEQKYQKLFDVPATNYKDYGSYWNNNIMTYNNAIEMLDESNSMILNVTGEIRRQPGSFTVITLDRKVASAENESRSELEKLKQKYRAYEGMWMASKVRNIISPQKQTFRQKVVLFRNFIPKIDKAQNIDEKQTKTTAQASESSSKQSTERASYSYERKTR